MASSVIDHTFRQRAALKREAPVIDASRAAGISAVCIEFVAKPHETLRVAAEVPHAIAGSRGCPPGAMVRMSPNEAILMHHFLCISDVQLSTMFTGGGLLRSGFTLIRNRWPSGETS